MYNHEMKNYMHDQQETLRCDKDDRWAACFYITRTKGCMHKKQRGKRHDATQQTTSGQTQSVRSNEDY